MSIRKIGLIGYPLSHSFSKSYFSSKIINEGISDLVFENIEMQDISLFPSFLQNNPEFIGIAVTIPHKVSVINYLDDMDELAKRVGSVNCLQVREGKVIGHNTDALGFEHSIRPLLASNHKKALVLGTGGSSKTVVDVLSRIGLETKTVSRFPTNDMLGYDDVTAALLASHSVVVNCTPVGMFGYEDLAPRLPYETVTDKHLFFDLIYNPAETEFLKKAKKMGAVVCNGLEMLHIQAEQNWKLWHQ